MARFDLNAVRNDLAGKIAAEGYTVALDPREVNPPCVVVGLPVVIGLLSTCVASVEIDVTPVCPPPGNADAVAWLLDAVPVVLDVVGATTAEPSNFTVGTQDLPAYTITVTTEAKE